MPNDLQAYRASHVQQLLWNWQTSHGVCLPALLSLLIEGTVELLCFRRAVEQAVARHEILRTNFYCATEGGELLQIVREEPRIVWSDQSNASSLSGSETRSFDLISGPVVRVDIFQEPERLRVEISLPALCGDRQSLFLLAQEIQNAYIGNQIPEDPVQYGQFAEYEHESLVRASEPEASASIRNERKTNCTVIDRPSSGSHHNRLSIPLSPKHVSALQQIAASAEISLSHLLLGCWEAYLARTADSDRHSWYVLDGRTYEELSSTIGPFSIPLPIRIPIQSSDLVLDVMKRASRMEFELRQDVQQLAMLITTAHEWQNSIQFEGVNSPTRLSQSGMSIEILDQQSWSGEYILKLQAQFRSDDVSLYLYFDETQVTPQAAITKARQFSSALESLATNSNIQVGELELVGAEERELLLRTWNATKVDFTQATVVELFEHQVALRPQALAVRDTSGNCLTYAQLNAAANRWARRLRHAGIGPEARVGVCLQRSCSLIVLLLGVLKSGAAYVPLDPSYPQDRLAFMVQDADLALLLTQASLASALPDSLSRSLPILRIEDHNANHGTELENQSSSDTSNLPLVAQLDNLAYVIYTSGSTGRPKGVMISHRGLSNYVVWATQFYAVTEGAGALLHSPLSFDLTVTSLFVPLAGGSTVVVVEQNQ
ncbi:MAG TPA: AMP-binding protein, partial [Candidatus Angelobacter sp.]|nr:AMP-binding protein [Candidatus Angelobacter sp.]